PQRGARRQPLLDFGVAVLSGEIERQAESLARASLARVAPGRFGQQVRCDPEQPRQCRAVAVVTEALARQPRPREGLRGQVARGPRYAVREPPIDGLHVPCVERRERLRFGTGRLQKGGVAALVVSHSTVHRTSGRLCIWMYAAAATNAAI